MKSSSEENRDPLLGGFYSPKDAARLLQIARADRVSRWVAGDSRNDAVIAGDYQSLGGKHALSFWDLMEVRFLEHFRNQGVSLQTLRKVAVRARQEMKVRHPFALSQLLFLTDRRNVFASVAKEEGDQQTWNLVTNQYELYNAIEETLAKGVAFDPATGLAQSFQPFAKFPNVIVDPRWAYGRPVIGAKRIPTATLYRLWAAENGNKARVASAFNVEESDVTAAIDFESALAAA
jgi:uncharacterized protein (DUF433 family)